MTINAYAARTQGGALERMSYDPGSLGPHQVEIAVTHCGICHSDLAMIENEWGMSQYPVVPGHEVIGLVAQTGAAVTHLKPGDRVGLGWCANSCKTCEWCTGGDQNLCLKSEATIVGRFGGFADKVRCDATFAIPIPGALDSASAAPMLCGGITVFNPLVQFNARPTWHVGVIGIGGLGHMALQFARAWGCRVTAFTGTGAKADEARKFGAHEVINSRDEKEIASAAGRFDMIISTVGAQLSWNLYLGALRPRGVLVCQGAVPADIAISPFLLIMAQRSICGTPTGSPANAQRMLQFAADHGVRAQVETFPMTKVNEALAHLKADKARYRVVLQA